MKDQFKKNTLHGISWSAGSQGIKLIMNLVITSILARLLLPEDYGLIGMITIATGFLLVLKDFGFGAALVQKKDVEEIEYASVFWLNVFMGVFLAIIVFLSAPLIASFYNEPQLIPLTKYMSLGFILNSIIVVPNNILYKKIQFKNLFILDNSSLLIGGVVGIIFAYNGWAYWSLVAQSITNQLVTLIVVFYLSRWKPSMQFSRQALSGFTSFSLPLITDSSINYWVRNLDNLLIGKYLGKSDLGYYSKAYNLMLLPVRQLSGTIKKVMFPSFSLIQNDIKRLASVYLKISAVIAFITFPLMAIMFVTSEHIILFLFGENWNACIPIFRVLCILGAFQSIATLSGNIYLAQGKTKLMLYVGLFTRSVMIASMVIGLFTGGLMGLVYGYVLSSSFMVFIEWYFVAKIINLNLMDIIRNLFPYFIFSSIMLVFLHTLKNNITLNTHLINLIFLSFAGAVIYLILTVFFKPKAYKELLILYKERR